VREAIRRLHAEVLITLIARWGAFVAQLGERDIVKIYDLRVAVEAYAAGAAALEATDAQIDELEALAAEIAGVGERRAEQFAERLAQLNNRFHRLIVIAAANPRLETVLSSILEVPLVVRNFRRYRTEELQRSMNQHLELVQALRAHDCAWARSAMSSHILAGRNALLRSLAPPASD
jgi:DNA-binding GntR family transcriptional regulator